MNGEIKFHKATGPAFHPGEVWVGGSGARVYRVTEIARVTLTSGD